MNIANIPATFQDAEQFFDSYERNNIAFSPSGAQLMANTVQVLKSRLSAPARPLTRPMLSAMFDDDCLTDALGLPRTTQLSKAALMSTLNIRNAIHRRRPLSTTPHFAPGQAGSSLYPNGYRLDEVGPENIMPSSRPSES